MARRISRLVALVALLSWLWMPGVGEAAITSVQIRPAQPTTQDTITFSLEGSFSDACWGVDSFNFAQVSPTEFSAYLFAIDVAQPGVLCALVIIPYAYSEILGPLESGIYTIWVTEDHQSEREPWPNSTSLTFEVLDSLPAVRGLTARSSGSDIVLRWPAVVGATGYRIYRGSESTFTPGPDFLLDSTATPGYTDQNVIVSPEARFFYNVTTTRW